MTKPSLFVGALILLAAAMINRILGFVNQMVVIKWIGSEGYGLLQLVYPTFLLLLVIATAGIPSAMAKVIAEDYARGRLGEITSLFTQMRRLLLASSVLLFAAGWYAAPLLFPTVIADSRAYGTYLALLPSLIFVAYASAYRGYYQGLMEMGPPAQAQVMEQVVRVAGGLLLAWHLRDGGIVAMAVGLALGITFGEAVGLLWLMASRRPIPPRSAPRVPIRWREYGPRLLSMALPLTLSRVAGTALMALDAILIPLALQHGGTTLEGSTHLFGQLTGVVMPLLGIPMVFTVPLVTTLIPGIAEGKSLEDAPLVRHRGTEAIRGTALIGLPAAIGLYFLAQPLTTVLFSSPDAAPILQILAWGALFFYLQHTTTGLLQGHGHVIWPLTTYGIGSVLRYGATWWLTAWEGQGLAGVAHGFNIGMAAATLLNLGLLARYRGFSLHLRRDLFAPLVACSAMAATFLLGSPLLPNPIVLAASSLGLYLGALILLGGLQRSDWLRLRSSLFKRKK